MNKTFQQVDCTKCGHRFTAEVLIDPFPSERKDGESQAAWWLNFYSSICRAANDKWWLDPKTGQRIERNKGELLMLMVSELAEAMEGERKNLMDDKLPHRKMAEVELADCLIRIFDYAGEHGLDLGGAFVEKMRYNAIRPDHKLKARLGKHGKKF